MTEHEYYSIVTELEEKKREERDRIASTLRESLSILDRETDAYCEGVYDALKAIKAKERSMRTFTPRYCLTIK